MTLSFSTKWPDRMPDHLKNQPNYFIQKIWMSLTQENKKVYYEHFYDCHVYDIGCPWDIADTKIYPKIHTIRQDSHDRWKAGNLIHPVINNRTPNRFQFAPAFRCVSTQNISIKWGLCGPLIKIDGKIMLYDVVEKIAGNDGFNSDRDFFFYFNQDFEGKIIHWTDLKY